jgi:arylformamidase
MRKTAPTSPDWLDEQYDNRARVPEHPAILDRWAAESECVRRERRCLLDRRYGDCPSESLDIFLPETDAGPAPVIVFIHGGWWRALDKADHSFVAPAFTEAGVLVVVPNYALCPAVSIDHIAVQMAQAVAWTWRCAPQYGGDRRRIVLVGHSAGGHLAAMLLTCLWRRLAADLPSSLMRGALAISGVFDLDPLRRTPFLQKDLRLTPASARRLSPVRLPPPAAPLYAVAGGQESQEFLRHLRSIEDAWGQTCVPVSETIPGTNHFTVLDELARPGSRLHHLAMALAFE